VAGELDGCDTYYSQQHSFHLHAWTSLRAKAHPPPKFNSVHAVKITFGKGTHPPKQMMAPKQSVCIKIRTCQISKGGTKSASLTAYIKTWTPAIQPLHSRALISPLFSSLMAIDLNFFPPDEAQGEEVPDLNMAAPMDGEEQDHAMAAFDELHTGTHPFPAP
jgi:hypothetical protein